MEPDVGAFHGTAEFTNSLEQPVPKCLPKKMRAAAGHAAARSEALPWYLQPDAHSRREQAPKDAEMQAIKGRGKEDV